MSKPRGVCIIMTQGASVYLATRTKDTDPFKGRLTTPGGKVEQDEFYLEAAGRELREETGLDISLGRLWHLGKDERTKPDGTEYTVMTFHLILEPTECPVWTEPDSTTEWKLLPIVGITESPLLMPGLKHYLGQLIERP